MDKQVVEMLARLAGLGKALEQFPGDVALAAAAAEGNLEHIKPVTDPAVEPWPPMRAGGGQ